MAENFLEIYKNQFLNFKDQIKLIEDIFLISDKSISKCLILIEKFNQFLLDEPTTEIFETTFNLVLNIHNRINLSINTWELDADQILCDQQFRISEIIEASNSEDALNNFFLSDLADPVNVQLNNFVYLNNELNSFLLAIEDNLKHSFKILDLIKKSDEAKDSKEKLQNLIKLAQQR